MSIPRREAIEQFFEYVADSIELHNQSKGRPMTDEQIEAFYDEADQVMEALGVTQAELAELR